MTGGAPPWPKAPLVPVGAPTTAPALDGLAAAEFGTAAFDVGSNPGAAGVMALLVGAPPPTAPAGAPPPTAPAGAPPPTALPPDIADVPTPPRPPPGPAAPAPAAPEPAPPAPAPPPWLQA